MSMQSGQGVLMSSCSAVYNVTFVKVLCGNSFYLFIYKVTIRRKLLNKPIT